MKDSKSSYEMNVNVEFYHQDTFQIIDKSVWSGIKSSIRGVRFGVLKFCIFT